MNGARRFETILLSSSRVKYPNIHLARKNEIAKLSGNVGHHHTVTRSNIPDGRRPSTALLRMPNNSYFLILTYSYPLYSFNYFPKQHNPTKYNRSLTNCGLQRQPQRLPSGRRKPVITTDDRLCYDIRFHEMSCAMQQPASCLYTRVALSNVVIVTITLLKLVYEELLMELIQA
jgi:hypothetical protein